jgi:hypothetical protein
MIAGDRDWDWSDDCGGCLVASEQLATCVYMNARGEVVIRQKEDGLYDEGDTIILLSADNAVRAARYILALVDVESRIDPESVSTGRKQAERPVTTLPLTVVPNGPSDLLTNLENNQEPLQAAE